MPVLVYDYMNSIFSLIFLIISSIHIVASSEKEISTILFACQNLVIPTRNDAPRVFLLLAFTADEKEEALQLYIRLCIGFQI